MIRPGVPTTTCAPALSAARCGRKPVPPRRGDGWRQRFSLRRGCLPAAPVRFGQLPPVLVVAHCAGLQSPRALAPLPGVLRRASRLVRVGTHRGLRVLRAVLGTKAGCSVDEVRCSGCWPPDAIWSLPDRAPTAVGWLPSLSPWRRRAFAGPDCPPVGRARAFVSGRLSRGVCHGAVVSARGRSWFHVKRQAVAAMRPGAAGLVQDVCGVAGPSGSSAVPRLRSAAAPASLGPGCRGRGGSNVTGGWCSSAGVSRGTSDVDRGVRIDGSPGEAVGVAGSREAGARPGRVARPHCATRSVLPRRRLPASIRRRHSPPDGAFHVKRCGRGLGESLTLEPPVSMGRDCHFPPMRGGSRHRLFDRSVRDQSVSRGTRGSRRDWSTTAPERCVPRQTAQARMGGGSGPQPGSAATAGRFT